MIASSRVRGESARWMARVTGLCAAMAWLTTSATVSHASQPTPADCVRTDNAFGSAEASALSIEGKIYFLPQGASSLPDFAAGTSQGSIFTDKWDISPREFTSGFPGVTDRFEWFAVDYQGDIYVPVAGEYAFRLSSDDGSRLSIDGTVVVDNDGVHPWDWRDGRMTLAEGDHHIRLSYFQGPATQLGLQLLVTPPGSTDQRVFRLQDFNKALAEKRRVLGVTEDKDQVQVRLGAEVLFDTGTHVLRTEATEALQQLSSLLEAYRGYPIQIEGHTDNVGSARSNMALSERRAASVRDWLLTNGGIPAGCVSVRGLGLTEPVADNHTAEGRQKNRRVEVKIGKGH